VKTQYVLRRNKIKRMMRDKVLSIVDFVARYSILFKTFFMVNSLVWLKKATETGEIFYMILHGLAAVIWTYLLLKELILKKPKRGSK